MTNFRIKDPGSAITHFIGAVFSAFAATPLLLKSYRDTGNFSLTSLSLAVFIISMFLLYAASTTYHTFDISPKINKMLRKIDGTYTPVCMVVLGDRTGWMLLALVWTIAIVGITIKACWITCPKWFSSILYIAMGWVCILAFSKIVKALPSAAFGWLLTGGVIYTVGGVIYALKLPIFNSKHQNFGSHEIFHLFVMGGSLCHYIMMYQFVA